MYMRRTFNFELCESGAGRRLVESPDVPLYAIPDNASNERMLANARQDAKRILKKLHVSLR